jgi:post-GPI attachment to proteins factor 2
MSVSDCSFYRQIIRRNRQNLASFAIFLNVIENFALLGLSLYTSVANYGELIARLDRCVASYHLIDVLEIHKNCFCTFIVVSEIYMCLSFYLNKSGRRDPNLTPGEIRSVNLKRNLFIINLTSILLATYFFVRHNDRCEGGSKSLQKHAIFNHFKLSFYFHSSSCSLFASRYRSNAVYTFFALFEYIVVLTNMGFHMTSAIDFKNQHLAFDWRSGLQIVH